MGGGGGGGTLSPPINYNTPISASAGGSAAPTRPVSGGVSFNSSVVTSPSASGVASSDGRAHPIRAHVFVFVSAIVCFWIWNWIWIWIRIRICKCTDMPGYLPARIFITCMFIQ